MLFKKRANKSTPKDYESNVFDLGDDDFDLGFDDGEGARGKRFGKGFFAGALDSNSRKNLLAGLIAGALPESYNTVYQAGTDTWSAIRNNYRLAQKNNRGSLFSIAGNVEQNIHHAQRVLPKKYYEKLERRTEQARKYFEEDEEEGLTTNKREPTEDEKLSRTLSRLFSRSEARREFKEDTGRVEAEHKDRRRDRIQELQFRSTLETLIDIQNSVGKQVSYQDSVTYRYQRKSLELQHRQFFALRDIRRLTAVGLDLHRSIGETLIHNSSLPDSKKTKQAISTLNSEQAEGILSETGAASNSHSRVKDMRDSIADKALEQYQESLPQFLNSFFPLLQKNIQQNIKETLMGVDTLSTMGSVGMGGGGVGAGMAGQGAGGMASSLMGRFVMPRVGKKLEPYMDQLTKKIKGRNHLASYWVNNAQSVMQDFAYDENADDGMLTGMFRKMMRANIPDYALKNQLPEASFNNIDAATEFNHLTQRSIVEIIPGYLSRILQVNRMMFTGDENVGMEVYDVTKGRFVQKDDAKRTMRSRIVSDTQRENIRATMDDLITSYKGDDTLSDEATHALRNRLMKDAALGNRFDPESYIKGNFGEDTPDATRDELVEFFRRQYDFDADDKLVREEGNLEKLNKQAKELLRLRDVMPNSKEEIERIHTTGSQELLREMGVVYSAHGQDYIDYEKLWAMYRGDDKIAGSNNPFTGPFTPADPLSSSFSGGMGNGLSNVGPLDVTMTNQRRFTPTDLPIRPSDNDVITVDSKGTATQGRKELKDFNSEEFLKESKATFEKLNRKLDEPGVDRVDSHTGKNPANDFKGFLSRQWAKAPNFKDLYNQFGKKILLKRDVENNQYVDVNTGRVINDIQDITGAVVDKDHNIVITAEDFERGLFDVKGDKQSTTNLTPFVGMSGGKKSSEALGGKLGGAYRRLMDSKIVKGFKGLKDHFNRDAYLPGQETPVITVKGLKEGLYTDKKGKVLRNFDDIGKHTIFDRDLNVVVIEEDLEKLVDVFGKPHPVTKNLTFKGRVVAKLRNAARSYAKWSLNYWKKLPGRTFRFGKALARPITNRFGGKKQPDAEKANGMGYKLGQKYSKARDTFNGFKDSYYSDTERNKTAWDDFDKRGPEDDLSEGKFETTPTNLDKDKRKVNPRFFKWMGEEKRPVHPKSINTPTDALLNRINDNIEKQHVEEPRDGSWQQILADRKKVKENEGKDKKEETPFKTMGEQFQNLFGGIGKLLGGLGGMMGLGGGGDTTIMGNPADLMGGRDRDKPKKKGWIRRSASAAARYGWMGAGFLGKGALAAGTGLVSAVGLPVLITGAVVAGALAGGYYLWKRHQERSGKLYRVRFAQYGIDPTSRSQALPVLEVESIMEELTRRDSDGNVDIDYRRMDLQAMFDAFKIDDDDKEHNEAFVRWLTQRFIPVWSHHQAQLGIIGSSAELTKVDDTIDKSQALEFIDLIAAVPSKAQENMDSPFGPEEELSATQQDVERYIEEAKEEYADSSLSSTNNAQTRQTGVLAGMGPINNPTNSRTEVDRELPPTTNFGTIGNHLEQMDEGVTQRSNIARQARAQSWSFLQKLRGYAYGLSHFDDDYLEALMTLEDAVFKDIKFSSDGQAEFNGNANKYMADHAEAFGIAWMVSISETRRWRKWFDDRFVNVAIAYAGKLRQLDSAARLSGTGNQLSKANQLSIANSIKGAQKSGWFRNTSIWEIDADVFDSHSPDQSLAYAEALIEEMKEEVKRARGTTPPPVSLRKPEEQGSVPHQEGRSADYPLLPDSSNMEQRYRSHVQGQNPEGHGTVALNTPMRPGGPTSAQGAVYGGLLSGTGGVFEDLPLPSKDADREAAMPTLRGVQDITGVDAELLATFAKIESNFRATVKADSSSATGWFQFIDKTWDAVIEKYGSKYGIPTNLPTAQRRELRKDPRINALMGAELLKENFQAIENRIGRTPTDTDLYLAHFMGAPRAGQILSSPDQNAIAAQLYPKAAEANKTVFWQNGKALTIGEIVAWADGKVAPGRREGAQLVNNHHTPDEAVTPTPQTQTPAGQTPSGIDISGVAAFEAERIRRSPSSQGPTSFDIYGQAGESTETTPGTASEVGDERRRMMHEAAERSADPYGPRSATYEPRRTTSSNEDVTEVEQRREGRYMEQRESERRQRERLEESSVETMAMGTIAQSQLDTQIEMKNYLKTIAERLDIVPGTGSGSSFSGEVDAQPSNDTSVAPKKPVTPTSSPGKREMAGVPMTR